MKNNYPACPVCGATCHIDDDLVRWACGRVQHISGDLIAACNTGDDLITLIGETSDSGWGKYKYEYVFIPVKKTPLLDDEESERA
jgi:hypothetical protein